MITSITEENAHSSSVKCQSLLDKMPEQTVQILTGRFSGSGVIRICIVRYSFSRFKTVSLDKTCEIKKNLEKST